MGRKKQNLEGSAKGALILSTASKMFLTLGYSAVSMDALAEAVPVSKPTLYNHFKDKKALFAAVMQSRCQTIFSKFEEVLQEDQNVEQTLTTVAKQYLSKVLAADSLAIYRTAIMQSQQFPELGKLFYEMGPKRSTDILAAYLKKQHAKKTLSIPNAELAAKVFLGMLSNRIHMKCMLGLKNNVSVKERADIIRYVVGVFLHGQQPR